MTKRRSSLTGSWSGAFRYPGNKDPETVFNAQIEEDAGTFVGTTQEPNLFRPGEGAVLTADIEGVRTGNAVSFTKFYDNQGIRHAIRYEGSVDAAFMRVEGTWTIPGVWSGTFLMARDDEGEAAEVEASVEVPIETRQ